MTATRSLSAATVFARPRATAPSRRRHLRTTIPSSRRRPLLSTSTSTALGATWKDYLPRIVDNIPRRIPPGTRDALEKAGTPSDAPGDLPFAVDVGGAVDALRRLVFPESLAAPADLTLPVVVFGALAVGLGLELATLALKAFEGANEGSGRNGSDGASSSSSAPPIDAPVVPRPPASKPSPTPPTTPTRAQIESERRRLRDKIVAERYRGLTWLAAATAAALFTAGLMSGPTALMP